ncbi:MAG: hypothetical protein EXR28_07130 [Betaproteobacteria bacterium]|nr:hypothetical protein [Betaproteobacteria bacterium]
MRFLRTMARRYLWWMPAAQAAARPDRVILQVMDIGDHLDVREMESLLGSPRLAGILRRAEAGALSARSWNYWHYRLGLVKGQRVPKLPKRRFA